MASGGVSRRLGIYMLDVGQGDATVILPPEGEGDPIVFDCRDDYVVHKCLDFWGRKRIHSVIISHLDRDHIAGALQLLRREDLEIERIYLNADRDISDEHEDARTAKELVDHVDDGDRSRKWFLVSAQASPTPVLAGDDWRVEILAPRHRVTMESERRGSWENPNVLSAVVRVTMNEQVVLVGGDAPLVTWAELAERNEVRARTFRVPHHGGLLADGGVPPGWSAERLYEEVGAREAVVSVGTRNSHGHPLPDWVAPACRPGSRLMCTQVTPRCHGSVLDAADDHLEDVVVSKVLVEPDWRHARDRYRVERRPIEVPCAGTVVVTLYEQQVRVHPSPTKHGRVIGMWGEALCRR